MKYQVSLRNVSCLYIYWYYSGFQTVKTFPLKIIPHILLCQIMYSIIKLAEFKAVQASCYYVSMSCLSTHPLFTSLVIHPLDLVRLFCYQTWVVRGFPLQNSQNFSN